MIKKKVSFGMITGGASLLIESLSGLIILPLLLHYTNAQIAGLWLFYTSLNIIVNLSHSGLAPIITRISAEKFSNGSNEEIANLKGLVDRTYKFVIILILIICFILFFSYIRWVINIDQGLYAKGIASWILFCLGNLVQIYFTKNIYIINGFGEVGWDKLLNAIISFLRLLGYFLVLLTGYDLIGLSFIYFITTFLYAFGSIYLIKKYISSKISKLKPIFSNDEIFSLFKLGSKILLLNVVGILVLKKDIYIVERFIGLEIIPSFIALSRVQSMIYAISLLLQQMLFPFITANYSKGKFNKVYNLYLKSIFFSMLVAIILSSVFFILGDTLVPLWLGEGKYLGDSIFGLMLLFGLINIHHNIHATAVISTGTNYFICPALINAFLAIILSVLGMYYFGITGMILGNILATVLPSAYIVIYSFNFFFRKVNEK